MRCMLWAGTVSKAEGLLGPSATRVLGRLQQGSLPGSTKLQEDQVGVPHQSHQVLQREPPVLALHTRSSKPPECTIKQSTREKHGMPRRDQGVSTCSDILHGRHQQAVTRQPGPHLGNGRDSVLGLDRLRMQLVELGLPHDIILGAALEQVPGVCSQAAVSAGSARAPAVAPVSGCKSAMEASRFKRVVHTRKAKGRRLAGQAVARQAFALLCCT